MKPITWTKIGDLEWSENLGEMSWGKAVAKCKKLGGRLPTRVELIDLFDNHYEEMKKLPDYNFGSTFWSSTENYSDAANAWRVYLTDGNTYTVAKTLSYYVRCVNR